jgi:outer membrane autotransporter protein
MKKLLLALILISSIASTSHAGFDGAKDNSNTMNFRFGALGLLVGILDVNLDFKMNDEWTVGPTLALVNVSVDSPAGFNDDKIKIKGTYIGARANWFKNGVYTDGLYVGPSLNYQTLEATTTGSANQEITAKGSALIASCLVGYGWFWESFNMMLGGGLSLGLGDSKIEVKDSLGNEKEVAIGTGLAMEYTLGWTF